MHEASKQQFELMPAPLGERVVVCCCMLLSPFSILPAAFIWQAKKSGGALVFHHLYMPCASWLFFLVPFPHVTVVPKDYACMTNLRANALAGALSACTIVARFSRVRLIAS